ncbi:methyltransferase domain-containing protein [Balneola sp. MJW-20]|uniref:methyltransferase domain-containing protein n=1 Tax=Gracilimonas aurantiaca TaxID=3234185 RepID=UPI0034658595
MSKKENAEGKVKKRWPVKAVMEQIYKKNLWGGSGQDFYSGTGSHDPGLVEPYVEATSDFLRSFDEALVVCDQGCGDFNIGRQLVQYTRKYIAVDIVEDLIMRNREKFKNRKVDFQCLDLALDPLPSGDCALLRQVLQHLSNAEIKRIVAKLQPYKYVIVTEHVPEGDFNANLDILSGQGIRLKKQSGVDLTAPPFNLKVKEEKELLSLRFRNYDGLLITTLYTIH